MHLLAPLYLVIGLGWLLSRLSACSDEFLYWAEQAMAWILWPALIIPLLATASFTEQSLLSVAGALATGAVSAGGVALFLRGRLECSRDVGSASMAAVAATGPNLPLAFACVEIMAGVEGLAPAAGSLLLLLLLTRLVGLHLWFSPMQSASSGSAKDKRSSREATDGQAQIAGQVIAATLTDPLLLSGIVGVALSGAKVALPYTIYEALTLLGRAAVPMGLLLVGARLSFIALPSRVRLGLVMASCKLLLMPLLALVAGMLYRIPFITSPGLPAIVLVVVAAVPFTPVLATRNVEAVYNPELTAYATIQALLSCATLPCILHYLC